MHIRTNTNARKSHITPSQYVACMNPTAGSFEINPRLQRLFMTLAMDFPGQVRGDEVYACISCVVFLQYQ